MSDERVVHRTRRSCRACGAGALTLILPLGPQPLANAFLTSLLDADEERFYPLDLCICEVCALVQLRDVIDPQVLFGHYLYVSGTSDTMAAHNARYAAAVVSALELGPSDLVLEVASNDGSLLRCFQSLGTKTLGVEPARNIADLARAAGVPTVGAFFNRESAVSIRRERGPARVVIANNVLAHVDDPADFLAGAMHMLTDDGRIVVEVPYAGDMLAQLEYDTVYHEHLCYFSVTSLATIAQRVGLAVVGVDRLPVHGGTIRVWFAVAGDHAPDVQELIVRERRGVATRDAWQKFAVRVFENRERVQEFFGHAEREGRSVLGYGAPAKANTFLNFCGIGPRQLPFTVDRNPLKVGRFTPGTHIPVHDVTELLEKQPDDVLILAWNFADEVARQQAEYARRGGRFLVAIPRIEWRPA